MASNDKNFVVKKGITIGQGGSDPYSLPDVDGTINQLLKTTGSGVVTWSTLTASDVGAASDSHNHTLDSLSNVTITSNASGELLMWNGTAWVNRTLIEADVMARSGGSFTGAVSFSSSAAWPNNSPLYFRDTLGSAQLGIYMSAGDNMTVGDTDYPIIFQSSITPVFHDGAFSHDIYHEGNLPAATATGGGSDQIFWENDITVTTNYTITTGKNAMSAGPITVANGVTVTVPSGSTWTVV